METYTVTYSIIKNDNYTLKKVILTEDGLLQWFDVNNNLINNKKLIIESTIKNTQLGY